MSYDFGLAWRNLRTHWVETLIPIVVVGLAIGLSLTIFVLADGLQEGIILSSDPFGALVVGPKGSKQELVTSAVLLQGDPTGTIPYTYFEELEQLDGVRLAVPLAFADSIGGAKIIGTNMNFFELRREPGEPPAFQIAEGRLWEEHEAHEGEEHEAEGEEHDEEAEGEEHEEEEHNEAEVAEGEEHEEGEGEEHEEDHFFEAVLGSRAAEELGLEIGDTFQAAHGYSTPIASSVHRDFYKVVGILEETNTPYDAAVLTDMENIWEVHAEIEEGRPTSDDLAAEATVGEGELTAILVVPNLSVQQAIVSQYDAQSTETSVAFPGKELTELYRLVDDAQELLNMIAFLVLGIAAFTVFLSMYSTTVAREQAIAVMRSLGSRRTNVFRVILFETLVISLLGAAVGRIFGYGAASVIANIFTDESAIPIPIRVQADWELLLWALPLAVGALAGIIPAIMAYRVDVVEKLFPT